MTKTGYSTRPKSKHISNARRSTRAIQIILMHFCLENATKQCRIRFLQEKNSKQKSKEIQLSYFEQLKYIPHCTKKTNTSGVSFMRLVITSKHEAKGRQIIN